PEHEALRVFEVSDIFRVGRACINAGRLFAALQPRRTEVALINLIRPGIDVPGIIRAGFQTVAASDTQALINFYDAVFRLVGSSRRARQDARGMVAVVALSHMEG